ncbi:hypothetical protein [Gordonia sp. (in: high G+C Gram-positive bacteria)]|uniref:hypothetical protein n=1 Tax=unclassified Gordonia (in: high G+C Gram-positive bacteria) TaxID=2657482 RepID=UPI0026074C3F|nr:hypothetical protein [Gordonia sp. (in: high G+C Gram-positive bacteria)]
MIRLPMRALYTLTAVSLLLAAFVTAPWAAAAPREWRLLGIDDVSTLEYTQGLAGDAAGRLHGRGYTTIRPEVAIDGWTHIGDGDLFRGRMYDAYEQLGSGRKLYTITEPDGRLSRYYHRLTPGEMANNSFVTVSPSGRYLVSGEWDTMDRLLVFRNPVGRPDGSALPLAGTIALDTPMRDVQSCDFVDATHLVCAVDRPAQAVYSVALDGPLDDAPAGHARGTVRREFAVPHLSACTGSYEIEGIDYDAHRRVLSVSMIDPSPCLLNTKVLRYRMSR